MDYVLKHLSNNDNEIEDVYKDGAEYIIKTINEQVRDFA